SGSGIIISSHEASSAIASAPTRRRWRLSGVTSERGDESGSLFTPPIVPCPRKTPSNGRRDGVPHRRRGGPLAPPPRRATGSTAAAGPRPRPRRLSGPPGRTAHYPGTVTRTPVVVLISGTGSNLAALLAAAAEEQCPYEVVAVLADREASGLEHARAAGIPTEVVALRDHPDRAAWDRALTAAVAAHDPQLVVLAGFMKLVGPPLLESFGGRIINTHPALLPAFPGAHGVRDAL